MGDGEGVLCKHCDMLKKAHAPDGKCLFEPTRFEPSDEMLVWLPDASMYWRTKTIKALLKERV